MKRFISFLVLFGITFIFNYETGTGVGYGNNFQGDALIVVRNNIATYCDTDGEAFFSLPDEMKKAMAQVFTEHGSPTVLWEISPTESNEDVEKEKETPKPKQPKRTLPYSDEQE